MMIQNRELEELQAKIRATEERLKARKSVILDGSGARSNAAQSDGGYQSTGKALSCMQVCLLAELMSLSHLHAYRIRVIGNISNGHNRPLLQWG